MSDKSADKRDIYSLVTAQIVAAIEKGAGEFHMPWHQSGGALSRPINVASGKPYQGINVVMLWGAASMRGYGAPIWGTFKQWLMRDCPVRKGEKAVPGVFYKDLLISEMHEGETRLRKAPMARAFSLFNAAQVENYIVPAAPSEAPVDIHPVAAADRLLQISGAEIHEGGETAYYHPGSDSIHLPARILFRDTPTSTATEGFYGVALHELTHWTGARHRLDRNLAERFRLAAVAMEELVAELGSAMLCADLGVSAQPRLDHAQYVASWLQALQSDSKAIFVASSAAQKAVTYLHALDPTRPNFAGQAAASDDDPEPA